MLLRGGGESGPVGDYRVWINSAPEGAEVFLNDQSYGKTPLQLSDLADGEYHLRLEYPEADPIDTQFTLTGQEQVTFPNFIITKEVYVNSIPQGAKVFVDGRPTELTTPALVNVPVMDSVNIRLEHAKSDYPVKLAGFKAGSGEFTADDDYLWETNFNESEGHWELIGRFLKEITISSKPQGADVMIEGREVPIGQTPGKMRVPFGSTKLILVKSGFGAKVRAISIDEHFRGSLFYEMFRNVKINAVGKSNPQGGDIGATIYQLESEGKISQLDEKTPTEMLLSGVEHRLFFKRKGYHDTSVIIGVNQNNLKVVMSSEAEDQSTQQVAEEPEYDENKANLLFVFIDRKSKDPIEGVDVIAEVKESRERILLGTTNEFGRLSVMIDPGKYKFISEKEGYREWDDGESIDAGKSYEYRKKLRKD
jgi:hypothetical protein